MVTSAERRADILRKVRGLLDTAASYRSSGNHEAADSYESKADQLMTAYTIESFELEFAKPANVREKPTLRDFEYGYIKEGYSREANEVNDELAWIFRSLAQFCRVKVGFHGWRKSKVVGYEADLEYLDLLFTTARIHLASNIEPKPHPHLSEYDNFVVMKEAGMKWERIWGLLHPGEPFNRSACQKLLKRYKEECIAQGKPQMKADPRTWQRSFVEGFRHELENRIYRMMYDRKEQSSGKELVLAGRDEELKEAFYEAFPELRPHPEDCDCESCHRCYDSKCMRRNCKAARKPVRASAAPRELRTDYSAYQAGKSAAKNVDLSGRDRRVGGAGSPREIG